MNSFQEIMQDQINEMKRSVERQKIEIKRFKLLPPIDLRPKKKVAVVKEKKVAKKRVPKPVVEPKPKKPLLMERIDKRGYRLLRISADHPYYEMATKYGWVREHRLVMAEQLGRILLGHEVVHHKNRIKHDNRPENLLIMRKLHHDLLTLAHNTIDELIGKIREYEPEYKYPRLY